MPFRDCQRRTKKNRKQKKCKMNGWQSALFGNEFVELFEKMKRDKIEKSNSSQIECECNELCFEHNIVPMLRASQFSLTGNWNLC